MGRILPLFLLLACSGDGDGPSPDGTTPETGDTGTVGAELTVLAEGADLPGAALLSVWGTSATDVWMVGADDGSGPLLLHYDGASWSRVDTGTTGDLWWVWGDGQGTLFLSGANGRVVTHDIGAGTFEEVQAADPNLTLFGIWGTSATDVWTVGGDVSNNRNGAMIHFDGTDWTEVAQPEGDTNRSAFKVWGRATDDVYVVGTGALITHWDGTAFTEISPSPVYGSTTLTTVSGNDEQVIAVGGFGNAVVARTDGSGWADDSPPPTAIAPGFTGIHVRDDQVVACGTRGSVWSRTDDGWAEAYPSPTTYDLHGCWIDPDGHVWAVGGDLISLISGSILTDADVEPFSL